MSKTSTFLGVPMAALVSAAIFATELYNCPHKEIVIPALPLIFAITVTALKYFAVYFHVDSRTERRIKKRLTKLKTALNDPNSSEEAKASYQKQFDEANQALINSDNAEISSIG